MKRKESAERAEKLLRVAPMTRFELECKLGISQQRVSEALRDLGAKVIGHAPRDERGRPSPLYSIERPGTSSPIGRVCSVWQLGGVA